ncbi:MAG: hypothetical protein WC500_06410 [Candidatus Margulisiibacteriota bacterium]
MDINNARKLVKEYGRTWEIASETGNLGFYPNSILPATKDEIKEAIKIVILSLSLSKDWNGVDVCVDGYVSLPTFIDKAVYDEIRYPILLSDKEDAKQAAISLMKETHLKNIDEIKLFQREIGQYVENCKKMQ